MVVERRVLKEKDLNTVTTTDLLKFLAQIMPKDYALSVKPPEVTYISNIPRDAIEDQVTDTRVIDNPIISEITEEVKPEEINAEPTVP